MTWRPTTTASTTWRRVVRSALNAEGWARARAAVEDGASFREVADEMGVAHTSISRAAARDGLTVPAPPWEMADAPDADLHVSEPQDERERTRRRLTRGHKIEPQGPLGERQRKSMGEGAGAGGVGAADDEASARL